MMTGDFVIKTFFVCLLISVFYGIYHFISSLYYKEFDLAKKELDLDIKNVDDGYQNITDLELLRRINERERTRDDSNQKK